MSFAKALEEHRAPRRLGDVTLRYEASMLIGETPRPPRTWRPTFAWLTGVCATLFAVGLLLLSAPDAVVGALGAVAIAAYAGAVWLERIDRRHRAFVVNFATDSLRLDFVTPFAGKPRTMVVHFDGVRAVERLPLPDGTSCLTVDFVPAPGSSEVLREVLVASIGAREDAEAERLQRVLTGAFGLGAPPADSPALATQGDAREESSFER